LLGDLQSDILLRLAGRSAKMRRANHIGMANSGFPVAGSFTNTSKAAPATWPLSSCAPQGFFIDQAAPRAIDDSHALLGLGEISADKIFFVCGVNGVCSL